jgi:hypothetical protein
MAHTEPVPHTFHEGDEVVLVEGTYQGTLGVFVRLRHDVGWADITERNGTVRSHPVVWIGHAVQESRSSVSAAAGNLEPRIE